MHGTPGQSNEQLQQSVTDLDQRANHQTRSMETPHRPRRNANLGRRYADEQPEESVRNTYQDEYRQPTRRLPVQRTPKSPPQSENDRVSQSRGYESRLPPRRS